MAWTFWTETDEKPLLLRASDPASRLPLEYSFANHPALPSARDHTGGDDADENFKAESRVSGNVDCSTDWA